MVFLPASHKDTPQLSHKACTVGFLFWFFFFKWALAGLQSHTFLMPVKGEVISWVQAGP